MAATVSAWAKPGAWALESEENEHEAMELLQKQQLQGAAAAAETSDFPSLAAAAATKTSKKKKKLSLAEFTTGKAVTHGAAKFRPSAASETKRLTTDEILVLPTGPRERTAEELERPRGFGYSSYGGGGSRYGSGEESGASRWGSSRGSDEPRRSGFGERGSEGGPGDFNRDSAPSLADEVDDWGAMKKSAAPLMERRERSGGFFDSQSRADDSDSWISNKSAPPPPSSGRRMNDGFRERRGGFEMFNKEGSDGTGLDADTWGKRREEPASVGRPRLVLQPRSLPLENGNGDGHGEQQEPAPKSKGSNPFEQQEPAPKSKGSNPFGAARPREEVLAEKGQDWKAIDEKLESMKIREPRPLSREGPGFGRRASEDRMEGRWRKGDSARTPSPPPSAEKIEEAMPDN